MNRNEQTGYTLTQTQLSLPELAENYDRDIALLTERIDFIKAEISAFPPPDKLKKLQMRLEVLLCERRDMRQTSARIKKLAGPKVPSPSLIGRQREYVEVGEAS